MPEALSCIILANMMCPTSICLTQTGADDQTVQTDHHLLLCFIADLSSDGKDTFGARSTHLDESGSVIKVLSLLLGLLFSIQADTIHLSTLDRPLDLLYGADVLIDTTGERSVETLLAHPEQMHFFHADKIELGYTDEQVWVMFSIKNESDTALHPFLEIDNPMLDAIHLYRIAEGKVVSHHVQGVLQPLEFHGSLRFGFDLTLPKASIRHYLLQVSSHSSALYFRATLMSQEMHRHKELDRQLMIVLFVGLMLGLIVYNGTIYLFTSEKLYLYYVGYHLFVFLNYVSMTTISRHLFPLWLTPIDAYLGLFYILSIMTFMLLFTHRFLRLDRHRWIDRSFKALWASAAILLALSLFCCYPLDLSTYLTLFSSVYILLISLYMLIRKTPNAIYFILGWGVSLFGSISLMLYQVGLAPYMDTLPYLYEFGVGFEAILFSLILSRRINHTKAITQALGTQKILTQELHASIQRSFVFIRSLYSMKFKDIENQAFKQRLRENESNIVAMSAIHQALMAHAEEAKRDVMIDAQDYFQRLLDTIRDSFKEAYVSYSLECSTGLGPDEAVHCGILLNELVINAYKYAFDGIREGTITVRLYQEDDQLHLTIADDGKGYEHHHTKKGFGLMMLDALVKGELHGEVSTQTGKGTTHHIRWRRRSRRVD